MTPKHLILVVGLTLAGAALGAVALAGFLAIGLAQAERHF